MSETRKCRWERWCPYYFLFTLWDKLQVFRSRWIVKLTTVRRSMGLSYKSGQRVQFFPLTHICSWRESRLSLHNTYNSFTRIQAIECKSCMFPRIGNNFLTGNITIIQVCDTKGHSYSSGKRGMKSSIQFKGDIWLPSLSHPIMSSNQKFILDREVHCCWDRENILDSNKSRITCIQKNRQIRHTVRIYPS